MTSKVYVALRVKAKPERAFETFVEEIGAWWRPSTLFQTTPRPGRITPLPDYLLLLYPDRLRGDLPPGALAIARNSYFVLLRLP